MTETEKLQFVGDMTECIHNSVRDHIQDGSIPEAWTGVELRQYLADKFNELTYPKLLSRREYENDVLIHNL